MRAGRRSAHPPFPLRYTPQFEPRHRGFMGAPTAQMCDTFSNFWLLGPFGAIHWLVSSFEGCPVLRIYLGR